MTLDITELYIILTVDLAQSSNPVQSDSFSKLISTVEF